MAVFRIEKTRDYTVMSNHHLKDRTLTLKSKGLLSMMLSLPRVELHHQRSCGDLPGRCGQHRCGIEGAGKPRVYPAHPASG